jgi:DNA primase
MVSKQVLEDIRFRNDIADVIGSYFQLQRTGSTFKALCPFHKEKSPSFHVNVQRQIFHCFGCGAGGDVFGFIMKYEGIDFMMAVRMLAERAHIRLEIDEAAGSDTSEKAVLYKLHAELAEFYQRVLNESKLAQPAREYCASRNLDEDIRKGFLIGYAPNRWDTVLKWADKYKHPYPLLETAGLLARPSSPDARVEYYDRFRNRLMFAIRDEQGRVIAFSGRVLNPEAKEAKYVNSPETPIFQKGRVLYALDKARKSIVDAREAIVCEGQIDVIRCHQAGFTNAVAAQGTAFTEDHVRTLRRYADSVILMFDSDRAGQEAAIRAAGTFMSAGVAVRVASVPPGEDPDSFIRKHGAEAFRGILDTSTSAVAFQIKVLSGRENARSEIGVMRIAKAVLQTILHTPNEVQKAKLIQEAAEQLRLPASALHRDIAAMNRHTRPASAGAPASTGAATPGTATTPATPAGAPARSTDEVHLCEHLARVQDCPELIPLIENYLPLNMFTDPDCRRFAEAALELARSGRPIPETLRSGENASEELLRFAAAAQMAPDRAGSREFSRADAVKGLILSIWQRRLKEERRQFEEEFERTKDPAAESRRYQATVDLKTLRTWKDGSALIEIRIHSA